MPPSDRLFEPTELVQLAQPAGDKIAALVDRGDLADARALAAGHHRSHLQILQIYTMWNANTLGHIHRQYGFPALIAALRESLTPWLRPVAEMFRNGVTREAVIQIARMWLYNCERLGPVQEDDAVIRFDVSGCGIGWQIDQASAFSSLPMPPPPPADAGQATVPFSVFRLAVDMAERLMCDWLGYPAFVTDFNATNGEPDSVRIYKDPSDIPPAYFDRIGSARDPRRIRGAVAVAGGLLFTPQERIGMTRTAMQRAIIAMDAGDLPMARGFAKQSKNEWFPLHHAYRDWITGQLSFVYRHHGVDAVYDAVHVNYDIPIMGPMLDAVSAIDARTSVETLAAGFLQHAMQFRIEEDDDKFTFITEPCGSGGRLLDEGAYDSAKGFARIKEKHKAGFFLENFPVYCVHCPTSNDMIFERGGPYYLMVDGDLMTVPDGNCNFFIFKNPDAIPENFYRRAGREKGDCGACTTCEAPVAS